MAQIGGYQTQIQQLIGAIQAGAAAPSTQQSAPPQPPMPAPTLPPTGSGLRLAPPERYSGEPGRSKSFLIECDIQFELSPHLFSDDRAKVAYILSNLGGRAKAWATAEWGRRSRVCSTLQAFQEALRKTFDPVTTERENARQLSGLRQGRESVCDYAVRFRTLAAESGWNDTALYDVFLKGLANHVRDRLLPLDLPTDLDGLITLAIRTDNRMAEFQVARGDRSATPQDARPQPTAAYDSPLRFGPEQTRSTSSGNTEEPMQMGRARLSAEERQRRMREGRCYYCGEQGHRVAACPVKSPRPDRASSTSRRLTTIQVKHHSITRNALIDSGADESLMDWGLAQRLALETRALVTPITASSLNGRELFTITHVTEPVELTIGGHTEQLPFYLYKSNTRTLVLGYPWLVKHNPRLDWLTGQVQEWGPKCVGRCIQESHASSSEFNAVSAHITTDSQYPDLTSVPQCYHHLKEVFNKTKATSLPPHRPYDCGIDLLPGAAIPKGRLYSMSNPERQAMNEYIEASLENGLIRPSSSPAGAGFFFVKKKDGSLRPCIDYSPLNNITIKNRYPLPLMSSVFDQLQQAQVFTKLDLRNAYHLVRIREGDVWKTGFNTPRGHYEYLVMPFGLTNAPAVFQAMINDVLREFLDKFVYVYLDDILIYSTDLVSHRNHVNQVLQRLLDNHLYVKAEKSEFHVDTISFLGFIVAPGKVEMDPVKVSAVADWPTPERRFSSF